MRQENHRVQQMVERRQQFLWTRMAKRLTYTTWIFPPPTKEARDAGEQWAAMINGEAFQRDDLRAALQRCLIQDVRSLRYMVWTVGWDCSSALSCTVSTSRITACRD
jgi:hypothetical protein